MRQTKIDFITFCCGKDAAKLHEKGQLAKQVVSNKWPFNQVIVVYQCCNPADYQPLEIEVKKVVIQNEAEIDKILARRGIDLSIPQYESPIDKKHAWRYHVVNHLAAAEQSNAECIVFADSDCWMLEGERSWIDHALSVFSSDPSVFVVSPNDGEPQRLTCRMSQQMFMVYRNEFLAADLNQPGWDRNVNISGGPMPEYWAMLEGRLDLFMRSQGLRRYVCPAEFRYWHYQW